MVEETKMESKRVAESINKFANATAELIESLITLALAQYVDTLPVGTTLEETSGEETTDAESTSKKTKNVPAMKKSEVESDPKADTENTSEYAFDESELENCSYNDLKKLAKECGIKAKGSRDALVKALLSVKSSDIEDDETEEAEEFDEIEESDVVDSDSDDIDEIAEVDDEDELRNAVLEATEDMTDDELADILSEAGLSVKGKRQALIDRVVSAVADGIIEFGDEDGEDDDSEDGDNDDDYIEDESEDSDVEDSDSEDDDIDETDISYISDLENNPDIPAPRAKAIKELRAKILKQIKTRALKMSTIKKYVKDNVEDIDIDNEMSKDELIEAYITLKCAYIDDDGDMQKNETPYSVNGFPFCCGVPLEYNESENTFVCTLCGGEYNADED